MFWSLLALAVVCVVGFVGLSIWDAGRRKAQHEAERNASYRMVDQIMAERRAKLADLQQHAAKGFDAQRKQERMFGVVNKDERRH